MTATPTDTDRERARNLLFPELANELPHNLARLQFSDEAQGQVDRIAQALADQRARYEAVADTFDTAAADDPNDEADSSWVAALGHAAARIRQVAR